MKNKIDKFRNVFFNSYVFSAIILIAFLKPYFISFNKISNMICNIFSLIFALIIYFYAFYDKKISKYQKVLFLFLFISLISTIIVSHDYVTWIKTFIKVSAISLYTELMIKKHLKILINSLSFVSYFLIFSTFVTTLLFPDGIFKKEMILLGYDNSTIVLLVFGSMFILFSYLFYNRKTNYKKLFLSIMPFIMTVIIYVIRWSVGALIGCILVVVLLLLYLMLNKVNICTKVFTLKNMFIFSLFVFVLVVFFNIQEYFSFIIVDIFHKDITLTNRTYIWNLCFEQIRTHILFGTGSMAFNSRLDLLNIYHAHCNYLNVILESGIIGFAVYLFLWKRVIHSADKINDSLSLVVKVTLFSYLIMTIVDVIDNNELVYIFLVIGYYLPFIHDDNKVNKLKKVLIIVDSGLPIPAVRGGAVETLVDYIVDENEKEKKVNIDIYSSYTQIHNSIKTKNKLVHYFYVKTKTFDYFILKCVNYIYKKIFKRYNSVFLKYIIEDIEVRGKLDYYDIVLIENSPRLISLLKDKIKSKYYLHLHNDTMYLNYTKNELNLYDKIICCSDYIKERIENVCSNKNISVIYNGVNTKELIKYNNVNMRNEMRKKYQLSLSAIVFGYCGRLCEDKGTKELISAFKEVVNSNKNVYLVLTGNSFFKDSKPTSYVRSLINDCKGYEDKIIFTGYLEHEKIGKFYSMIDVYIQPSIVNEACPLTIIEAQIMNKNIITTNSGGIPNIIVNSNVKIVKRDNLTENLIKSMVQEINDHKMIKRLYNSHNAVVKYEKSKYASSFLELFIEE